MSTQACRLSTKDYTILEVMLDRHAGRDETVTAILRQKVSGALVMFRDDVPPDVVTLGSRVAYQVDDGPRTRPERTNRHSCHGDIFDCRAPLHN
jgi:regulator of nucleoside diphosphate kinase